MAFDRIINSEDEINSLAMHVHDASGHDGTKEDFSDRGILVLRDLLNGLDPYQRPGAWVYAEIPLNTPCPPETVFTVIEDESRTIVLPEEDARAAGLKIMFRAAWITLRVHSALEAVGLVAQISTQLAGACIPSNIVAGARHDHILVPYDLAAEAMKVLRDVQLQT